MSAEKIVEVVCVSTKNEKHYDQVLKDKNLHVMAYVKGARGDDFTYDMFTPEQLEALKVKGDKGDKGDAFTFDDFTPEQLESLKVKGEDGMSANEILMSPDPEKYFLEIYGKTTGDIIGDLVINPSPIDPDPSDTFESILKM